MFVQLTRLIACLCVRPLSPSRLLPVTTGMNLTSPRPSYTVICAGAHSFPGVIVACRKPLPDSAPPDSQLDARTSLRMGHARPPEWDRALHASLEAIMTPVWSSTRRTGIDPLSDGWFACFRTRGGGFARAAHSWTPDRSREPTARGAPRSPRVIDATRWSPEAALQAPVTATNGTGRDTL